LQALAALTNKKSADQTQNEASLQALANAKGAFAETELMIVASVEKLVQAAK